MTEEKKPKRKYTRRRKVEPLAVYSVVVTVKRGRKTETIYGESTRTENGCLVVVSMDGPPPLVERVRYIPLGSAEIEVCRRPQYRPAPYPTGREQYEESGIVVARAAGPVAMGDIVRQAGPRIEAGPLGQFRQGPQAPRSNEVVERNGEGAAVVTTGYLQDAPS